MLEADHIMGYRNVVRGRMVSLFRRRGDQLYQRATPNRVATIPQVLFVGSSAWTPPK